MQSEPDLAAELEGRGLEGVEVRPACPRCGHRIMQSYGRPNGGRHIYRRCESCGFEKKFIVLYGDEVVVQELRRGA
jgi:tRNA(Ile2) C34 agmatinyltransferase TiaS